MHSEQMVLKILMRLFVNIGDFLVFRDEDVTSPVLLLFAVNSREM